MSFAIIETGGKQYKISEGDTLRTEKFSGEYQEGDSVTFDKVLLISDGENVQIGNPYISGTSVEGSFKETAKGKKVDVIRFRAKSRYHRKYGHRQPYSEVEIGKIGAGSAKKNTAKHAVKKVSEKNDGKNIDHSAHQKSAQKPEDIGKTESTSKAPKKETKLKTEKSRMTNTLKGNKGEMKETESQKGKGHQK